MYKAVVLIVDNAAISKVFPFLNSIQVVRLLFKGSAKEKQSRMGSGDGVGWLFQRMYAGELSLGGWCWSQACVVW